MDEIKKLELLKKKKMADYKSSTDAGPKEFTSENDKALNEGKFKKLSEFLKKVR